MSHVDTAIAVRPITPALSTQAGDALASLDRQIGHLDFLRTHLHSLLRSVGHDDAVAASRLAEQLECTEARLADLELQHDRLLTQSG